MARGRTVKSTVELSRDNLRLVNCAEKDGRRPILGGLLVTEGELVASDGFKIIRSAFETPADFEHYVIPSELLQQVKLCKKEQTLRVEHLTGVVDLRLSWLTNGTEDTRTVIEGKAIAGTFPNYKTIIDFKDTPHEARICFAAEHLRDILKALPKDGGYVVLRFYPRGENASCEFRVDSYTDVGLSIREEVMDGALMPVDIKW